MANKDRGGRDTKSKPLRTKAEKRAPRRADRPLKGGKRARRTAAAQHTHHG